MVFISLVEQSKRDLKTKRLNIPSDILQFVFCLEYKISVSINAAVLSL